ncbi:hypothetical protein EB796_024682 [Bugula neritina]|uniref:Uncharacterized protein n=1 Tax=Bugula neritina TaxID=10212 RepID=A0A7J7ISU7_BUGNE|nr:hypothetical protein EB796_024682 [Bugula neritina]
MAGFRADGARAISERGNTRPVRQPVDENHYDLSPTTRVTDRPDRPYKPRNLSDQTTLDSLEDDAFQGSHSVLKVSKSFRTRAFTKDSVFSDSEDAVPPCTHEDIKLPSRINTNDSSSSSQIDSSSDEEDVDIENKNKVESEYDVLPPPKDVQPLLPARLHNKPLSHTHTMDSIKLGVNTSPFNVKRSSSMSQVLPPPHGSMSKVGVHTLSKLPNMGGASPNLALRHQKQLRSERSSSVCANDWRNKTADISSTGLSQIMPVHRPVTPVAGDIQYIELEQNQERAEPSPKPSRSSLSSTNFTANSNFLEYTDIDILKTQALTETRRERDLNLRRKVKIRSHDGPLSLSFRTALLFRSYRRSFIIVRRCS